MTMIDSLPDEALAAVFAYLDGRRSLACRGVCRRWRGAAGRGVLSLRVKPPPGEDPTAPIRTIGSATLCGRALNVNGEAEGGGNVKAVSLRSMERTRGHLPKPASLAQDVDNNSAPAKITFANDRLRDLGGQRYRSEAIESGNILSLSTPSVRFSGAIPVENVLASPLVVLDLSASSACVTYGNRYGSGDEEAYVMVTPIPRRFRGGSITPTKSRTLSSALERLDVSGLQHLRELSVRGCSHQERLHLPPSLRSLDAGSCTQLDIVDFPRGVDGSLCSLDLSGCRKMGGHRAGLLGTHTVEALRNVVHLDVSQVPSDALGGAFCDVLRCTGALEMFSIRYTATDKALRALAMSESARGGTLRLVDVAFSTNVTDEPIELLARNAVKLERVNMRGCKNVAVSCYNRIPVYLERRRRREGDEELPERDESFRSSSRKGDNLFYFCKK